MKITFFAGLRHRLFNMLPYLAVSLLIWTVCVLSSFGSERETFFFVFTEAVGGVEHSGQFDLFGFFRYFGTFFAGLFLGMAIYPLSLTSKQDIDSQSGSLFVDSKLILPRNLFLSSALNFVVEKPISSGKAETVALKINIMQTSAAAAPPKNLPNLCITLMHLAINIPLSPR